MGTPHSQQANGINSCVEKAQRTRPITQCNGPHHTFDYDKRAWNIGTIVLIEKDGICTECIIQEVSREALCHYPTCNDLIKVQIIDNNITETVHRYELRSTNIFLQQRYKLRRDCMVEIYSSNQWIPAYIDKYGTKHNVPATNHNTFSVNNMNYDRFDARIRCCPEFSTLSIHSNVSVFDFISKQWMYGQISDNKRQVTPQRDNQHLDLNVFVIKYYKNGIIYTKWLHEFSASLCCVHPDDIENAPRDVLYINKDDSRIHLDETDLFFYRMLFKCYAGNDIYKRMSDDVLFMLMTYTGFLYELVMCIESKTWSLTMDYRVITNVREYNHEDSMDPSLDPVSPKPMKSALSKSFLTKMKTTIKNKLQQRGGFTESNFNWAQELALYRGDSYPLITKQEDDMKDSELILPPYRDLPHEYNYVGLMDVDSDSTYIGDVESLEYGSGLDLQTDYEI